MWKEGDNYQTGYLHTLKDLQFQNDLMSKLKSTFELNGGRSNRNYENSNLQSKNDSFENQQLLTSKLTDLVEGPVLSKADQGGSLESHWSGLQSVQPRDFNRNELLPHKSIEFNSDKKPVRNQKRSSNESHSGSSVSSHIALNLPMSHNSSSNTVTPLNAQNLLTINSMNVNTSAKSSGIVNCSTDGQEEPLDLQSPETKTLLLKKLYALKEEHQMYESDNSEEWKSPNNE